jgi:hypothetical protein
LEDTEEPQEMPRWEIYVLIQEKPQNHWALKQSTAPLMHSSFSSLENEKWTDERFQAKRDRGGFQLLWIGDERREEDNAKGGGRKKKKPSSIHQGYLSSSLSIPPFINQIPTRCVVAALVIHTKFPLLSRRPAQQLSCHTWVPPLHTLPIISKAVLIEISSLSPVVERGQI